MFYSHTSRFSWLHFFILNAIGTLVAFSLAPVDASSLGDRPLKTFAAPTSPSVQVKQNLKSSPLLADGVYLYGQSAVPNQIGTEYLVFKVDRGSIRGAIYYPRSEFNCFTATIGDRTLQLAIRDPQDRQSYPYPIAFAPASPVANRQAPDLTLTLQGYYPLPALSASDRTLLRTCS